MKVLIITGDKNVLVSGSEAHSRLQLQRTKVETLVPLYWGGGSLWPEVPPGFFDVVTVQDPFWRGLFGWWVAKRLKARFNVQVHTDLSQQSVVRHILSQIVLRHANSVRVVSQKIKEQVMHVGVRVPVVVLPVYVDLSRFQNVVRELHGQKTILWVGRFEIEKVPSRAIEILKEIRSKGVDAKLIMLGKGSLDSLLRASAKGFPVEFPGWQEPLSYLKVSDVVLSTSLHESWGVSMIEALAAGVPVVAPDVGVAKEAGAIVTEREHLTSKVVEVLQNNMKGELKISLLPKEEWAKQWKESL